ncbi:MAG: hypothetical protein JWM15_565, partial [Cryptosporangiaceae bacterium]|nr:hypothetical protein [Cryptosporangiaceae bacterium]
MSGEVPAEKPDRALRGPDLARAALDAARA